jgi:peptide/nickel transport system permease protein
MMGRFRFLLQRPLELIPVLFGVSLVSFLLVRSIPGDPARLLLGIKATPSAMAAIRARFGLDQPLSLQYFYFVKNALQGEFGKSIVYKSPVSGLIADHIAPTVFLILYTVVIALLMTAPAGVVSARRAGEWPDQLVRFVSTLGLGLPPFWLGIILVLVFSLKLGLFPVSGYGDGFLSHLHHLFLGAFTLALALAPVLIRNLRASLIVEQGADYVIAARSKGLNENRIFFRHVFPNSLIPTINLLGVTIGFLIGATVVVESVFAIPGLGQLMVNSIVDRDYMVVQAVTLVFAVGTILVSLIADLVTLALDPRIKG